VDVSGTLRFIQACLARLPIGVVQVTPDEIDALQLPVHRLELTERPG
jgi:hypothetical protein